MTDSEDLGQGKLTARTWIPLGSGVAVIVAVVGAFFTLFQWRADDARSNSDFRASIESTLRGIEKKVDDLNHRIDLFEQSVKVGTEDRFRKADMKLWLFKARLKYPDLPDVE